MKREIKFRAWTGEEMISPDYISRDGFAYYKENSIPCKVNTIMQFTGLKDKNGIDIYEGDVLNCDNEFIFIKYLGCSFEGHFIKSNKLLIPIRNNNYSKWEIIGNIYENPELLNK